MKLRIKSNSVEETMKFASKLGELVSAPAIILLQGDLGAGKTHFVKGFAKGLGSEDYVTSPTFTIMNTYEGGKCPLYHFDMYRLASAEEGEEAGLAEYFDKSTLNGISIVEWPDNVKGLITGSVLQITINKLEDDNSRLIEVEEVVC